MPDHHIEIKFSKINFLWLMMGDSKFQLKTKNNSMIYMGKNLKKCSTILVEFSAAPLLFRSFTPIRYDISWIWLAPKNAGHFVVDPICGP